MKDKPVFWVNSFNKSKWTYAACEGALAQTIPCHILFTDAQSSDDSWQYIEKAIKECPRGADHDITWLKTPTKGVNTFSSLSDHFTFALQTMQEEFPDAEWLLQCSSDDFSLPDRAKVCMEAVDKNPCSAIATTMFFAKPEDLKADTQSLPVSGYQAQSGYVNAGEALQKLCYGSVIAGYSRKFLEKVGGFTVTPDVYYGFLAAIDEGFYVVNDPQHIHIQHSSDKNLGFGGKLLAATGGELARLNELNHFQLYELYRLTLAQAAKMFPSGIAQNDLNSLYTMMLNHSMGWYEARKHLHLNNITPGVL